MATLHLTQFEPRSNRHCANLSLTRREREALDMTGYRLVYRNGKKRIQRTITGKTWEFGMEIDESGCPEIPQKVLDAACRTLNIVSLEGVAIFY